jgi:hypothetical protein
MKVRVSKLAFQVCQLVSEAVGALEQGPRQLPRRCHVVEPEAPLRA